MHEFDRIFNRKDMAVIIFVDVIDHRRQRRRLARTGRAGHQNGSFVPVIAPIGVGEQGETYNIADDFAQRGFDGLQDQLDAGILIVVVTLQLGEVGASTQQRNGGKAKKPSATRATKTMPARRTIRRNRDDLTTSLIFEKTDTSIEVGSDMVILRSSELWREI